MLVVLPDVLFIIAYHLENKPSIIIIIIIIVLFCQSANKIWQQLRR